VARSLPSWHQEYHGLPARTPKTALALREHKTKIRSIVSNFCLPACRLPVIRGSCRPAHCGPNLGGGANRQRAHVSLLDRKRERPFLSEHRELLPGFLGAAISLDPIRRCHARSLISPSGPVARAAVRYRLGIRPGQNCLIIHPRRTALTRAAPMALVPITATAANLPP
jgi:hypothetical protein